MITSPTVYARPTIRVRGESSDELHTALLSLQLAQPAEGPDRLELRLVGVVPDGRGGLTIGHPELALGDELEVELGGEERAIAFEGTITALEERHHSDAAPELVLLAEDALHVLARRRDARVFEDTGLDDVVSQIARDAGLASDVAVSRRRATWHQLGESDLAFLRRLLAPHGVAPRLDAQGRLRARPAGGDGAPIALHLGRDASRARLVADLARQHSSVRSSGFHLPSGRAVAANADRLPGNPGGDAAADVLGRVGWPGKALATHPFALSAEEADAFAAGAFAERGARFLRGELTVSGDPKLRPHAVLELDGASDRFVGEWAVVASEHRFDLDQGYQTMVHVVRGGIAG